MKHKALNVSALVRERQRTHGDFVGGAALAQGVMDLFRATPNWNKLTPQQREATQMIVHKQQRILFGDPQNEEHWKDIAGYADCALRRAEPEKKRRRKKPRPAKKRAAAPAKKAPVAKKAAVKKSARRPAKKAVRAPRVRPVRTAAAPAQQEAA